MVQRYPRDFPRLLGDRAFVTWVAASGGPVLRRVAKLADPAVNRPSDIADGFSALEVLARQLPPCPLRTEAKLLLAVRDALNHHRWLELAALARGELEGTIAGYLHGEEDAQAVVDDLSVVLERAIEDLPGGWASLVSGGFDGLLKKLAQPLMTPYHQPLTTLADVLANDNLHALLDLALSLGLSLRDVLLTDLRRGDLQAPVLGRLADGRLADADVKHLFTYLTRKKSPVRLDPTDATVRRLFDAYPPFAGADLRGIDAVELRTGAELRLDFSSPLEQGLTPRAPSVTANDAVPPASASAGTKRTFALRRALDTVPPTLVPQLADRDFVEWFTGNPSVLRGLARLAEPAPTGSLDEAFTALDAFAERLPPGSELENLAALVPSLRRIFGDRGTQQALQPLLAKNAAIFTTFHEALRDPAIVATLGVTKRLGVPLEEVLSDVLTGRPVLDPAVLTAIVDGKLSAAHVRALFSYLLKKKRNGFILDLADPGVKMLLQSYPPFKGADLSQVTRVQVAPGMRISFELSKALLSDLVLQPPTVTAGDTPGSSAGEELVFGLRRALDTLPKAFRPLLKDEAFAQWISRRPDLLAAISTLCQKNPPASALPGAFAALAELTERLPRTSRLRSVLTLVPAIRGLFGDEATASAMQPYVEPDQATLRAFHRALTDPAMVATLTITNEQALPLTAVLEDVLHKRDLSPQTLAHIVDRRLEPADIRQLFGYLRNKKGSFTLALNDPSVKLLLSAFPPLAGVNLSGVSGLRVGPGNEAAVIYTPEMMAKLSPREPTVTAADPVPGEGASNGEKLVYSLRRTLDTLPHAFLPLVADEAFATWIAAHPEVIHGMLEGPDRFAALAAFGEHLPSSSELKSLIVLVPVLRAMLGDDAALDTVRPLLEENRQALEAMQHTLSDPNLRATLAISSEIGLPITRLLGDVASGVALPPATLARLVDNRPTAADLAVIMDYLGKAGGGAKPVTIEKRKAELQRILGLFPVPKSARIEAITGMTLGPKDRIRVELSGTLAKVGPIALNLKSLEGQVKLDPKRGSVVIDADFGSVFRAVFVDAKFAPTKNEGFNTFLDILLKILLAPFLLIIALIGEIGGMEVRLDDVGGQPRFRLRVAGITLSEATRPAA